MIKYKILIVIDVNTLTLIKVFCINSLKKGYKVETVSLKILVLDIN